MRLVFLGSGEFGLPTLATLSAGGWEMAAVVSQPDRPAGRGGKARPTPISAFAREKGLPLFGPESPNTAEFAAQLAELQPDLAVIVAYGHLIGKALLSVPRLGFINLHASLLPAYRGAAPVPWAILRGETISGATVFLLDERFDTGRIISQVRLPIEADDTSGTYLRKLSGPGAELMANAVADLAANRAVFRAQDGTLASKAPKLRKEDGRIDWSDTFDAINNRVRAFQPWPQAFTHIETTKGLVRINLHAIARSAIAGGQTPGALVAADQKHGLVIMAGDGPVRLAAIQPEGKRPMADIEYLRGSRIAL